MHEVAFDERRFPQEQNRQLAENAASFAADFGYRSETLTVDGQLAQLLRLRVSQLNHCTYCLVLHAKAARDLDIPAAKIDTLSAWWETNLFSEAEQAALAYTEALTHIPGAGGERRFDRYHQALTAHFTPSEVGEIAGIVINMNVWTRLKLATGSTPKIEDGA